VTSARVLKRHLWTLIAGCFLFPIALIGLTFWVDPLQIFHDQPLEKPLYRNVGKEHGSTMRYFGRGALKRHLVRRKDRETVIFGWCHTGNFVVEEVEALGGFSSPLNFSVGGTTWQEISVLFDSAMKCSCVKTVISIAPPFRCGPVDLSAPFPTHMKRFEYLLKEGYLLQKLAFYIKPFDEIPYLVWSVLACKLYEMLPQQMQTLRRKCRPYSRQHCLMNKNFRGAHIVWGKQREALLNKPMKKSISPQLMEIITFIKTRSLEEINARFNTLSPVPDDFFLEKITQRSDVTFHFFIPPMCSFLRKGKCTAGYSYNSNVVQIEDSPSYIANLLYIVNAVKNFPNVYIYAFDDVPEIVGNPANFYPDGYHFGIGINRYILKSMKVGKHRITKANVLEYLRRMADVLLNFDPTPDLEHTVAFEGPLNEESAKAFAAFPPPIGPHPLDP
jgi:hypothetical protein